PHLSLPPHEHELASITVIVEGGYKETIGGSIKEMCNYSLITKPPGVKHSNHCGNKGARVLIIEPEPAKLDSLRLLSKSLDNIELLHGGNLPTLVTRLYQESYSDDTAAALVMEGLVMDLIGQVTRMTESSRSSPPDWLLKARSICDEQFREP